MLDRGLRDAVWKTQPSSITPALDVRSLPPLVLFVHALCEGWMGFPFFSPFSTAVLLAPLSTKHARPYRHLQVMIDRGRIDEPSSCHMCGNTMSMELVHNRCLFTDKQMIRLQVCPVLSACLQTACQPVCPPVSSDDV